MYKSTEHKIDTDNQTVKEKEWIINHRNGEHTVWLYKVYLELLEK